MSDEDRVLQRKLETDLDDIVGISLEGRISLLIVSLQVRAAGADMIEENGAETILERRCNVPPHVLVAAEPPCANTIARSARTRQLDVVS